MYETRTHGGVRGAPVGLTAHRPSTRLATGVLSYPSIYDLFSLISSRYQSAPTYPRSTNLFCFLSVGNPKTVLKGGYVGWKGGSSFASLWTKHWLVRACKCAYDCGLTLTTIIILLLWWAFHTSVTTINTTISLFWF